jgi:class 3 adenylate cyclase
MVHRGDERKAATQAQPLPRPPARPDHRIGDTERQQAIEVLRAHTGAGRLTLDEFSDLAGAVYAAQTYAELEAVGRSLPPGLLPEPGEPQDAPVDGAPAPTSRGNVDPAAGPTAGRGSKRQRFIAVMCGSNARGSWRPASRIGAFAFWGGVNLDFRYAEVDGPVDVTAWALMGGVNIVVAEGSRVELDGMVLMGGATNATRNAEPVPGSPTIRVHARGMWGGVTVRSRKTRAQRAAAADAAVDPALVDLRAPGLLELPQRILDDVAAAIPGLLAGPGGRPHAKAHRHRHGHPGRGSFGPDWGGSVAPGPPSPPEPPWARPAPGPPSADTSTAAPPADAAAAVPNSPSGTLTMMVTDIVGSTGMAESLGDRRWITVLRHHNELVRAEVAQHGGTEVKAQGDGFLVVFPSARRAILAAMAIQRAVCASDEHPDAPLRLRIGLHTGEIVDMDGDVLGQNVVVAVRIAAHARPGEIVVSGLTRDLTAAGGDIAFDDGAEVELKGLSQPWRVHRVSWSPAPA